MPVEETTEEGLVTEEVVDMVTETMMMAMTERQEIGGRAHHHHQGKPSSISCSNGLHKQINDNSFVVSSRTLHFLII